jgi:hypothetical protein
LGFENSAYSTVGFYNTGAFYNGNTNSVPSLSEFRDGDEISLEVNYNNKTVAYMIKKEVQPILIQNIPDNLYFAV